MTIAPPFTVSDAYGRAYLEAERAKGMPGKAWLVIEWNGAVYREDAADYFGGPEAWMASDVVACEQARGRVLDVGCGAGRHALHLSRAGYDVVAIDVSPDAVAVARRRGVNAHLGSLEQLPDDLGSFDTFLFLGANLPLLFDDGRACALLERLARIARPGAQLLGSDELLGEEDIRGLAGNGDGLPRLRMRARVESGGDVTPWSEWMSALTIVDPNMIGGLIEGSGWQLEEIKRVPPPAGRTYVARLSLTEPATLVESSAD